MLEYTGVKDSAGRYTSGAQKNETCILKKEQQKKEIVMHNEELTPVQNSDQELIDVNKSKLADNISNLLVLIFSISIVAWIIQVIILCFS